MAHRAAVATEECQHAALVRLDNHKADAMKDVDKCQHYATQYRQQHQRRRLTVLRVDHSVQTGCPDNQQDESDQHHKVQEKVQESVVLARKLSVKLFCFHCFFVLILL